MNSQEARLLKHMLRAWSVMLRTTVPPPVARIADAMDREADKLDHLGGREWTPADWDK